MDNRRLKACELRVCFFLVTIFASSASWGATVCQSEKTMLHYATTECRDTIRPTGDGGTFTIRSMKILANAPEPASRPTLILLPGGPGESAGGMRQGLEAKGLLNAFWHSLQFNVILFDPRGTGASLLPGQPDSAAALSNSKTMNLKLLVEDFAALVDDYQLKKVVLFSHSFGAFTAAKYAELHPERVDRVIMVSPMTSARGLGQINLMNFGRDFPVIEKHLFYQTNPEYIQQVRESYAYIDEIFFQQLKAQITGIHKLEAFNGVSLTKFRKEVLLRLSDIREPSEELLAYLQELVQNLRDVAKTKPLITRELQDAKVEINQLITSRLGSWRIIANHLICSEAITEAEKTTPTFYDGITYQHRCENQTAKFHPTISDPKLETIEAPVLILSGDQDTQVPMFYQQEIAARLQNSRQVRFPEEGHFPGMIEGFAVYEAIEAFVP